MSRLDRAFRRYCATRDPRALALVFDRAAPQLMGLARYLAGNAAEDVVQDTFLVAIERAGSFMPEARVMPWLVGILVLKAKEARRPRRNPAERTAPSDPAPSPDAQAAQTELHAHLHAALARLPARYRDVVTPMLHEGLAPEDVARRLARNPSTVRTQLARGLEHLRRLLPAGSATAVAAPAPAAIARMRQEVLSAGGGEVAATSGARVLSIAAALVLVGAGVTTALMWRAREEARQQEATAVTAVALAADLSAVRRDEVAAAGEQRIAVTSPTAAAPSRTPAEGESGPSPAAELVDVTGTCVDATTGQPIADCEVTAHGWGANEVARLVYGDSAWQDPEPVRTGADGRFVHRVDPTPAMQYVIEARAAGRAALGCRFLGSAAAAGLDLGALRLERGHGVSGRVVDETGRPVPGLSVTFRWNGIGTRERDESASMAFEADAEGAWQRRSDDWPLLPPRRFQFSPGFGPPSDSYSLGDNHVIPHTAPEAALAADGTIRLDLVVRRPREISGRVVDEHDVGVAEVVVVADASGVYVDRRRAGAGGAFALRAPADRTGTVQLRVDGDFDTLQPTAAIAWGTTDVEVRVRRRAPTPPSPRPTVQLDVVDAVTGAPVGRFGLHVHPPQPPGGASFHGRLWHAGDHPDGRLEVQDIAPGKHYLEVIPGRGHEPTCQNIEVPREGLVAIRVAVLPVTFPRLVVRVERRDGAAVAGADLEVIEVLPGKTIDAESALESPLGSAFGHHGHERGRGRTGQGGECAIEVTKPHGVDTFTLRVRAPGLPPAIVAGVRVPDQHGRAVVVVDEGAELRVRLEPPSLGLLAPRLRLLSPSNRLIRSGTPVHTGAGNPFAPDGTLVIRGLPAGDVQPELVVVVTVGFDIPHRLELLPTVSLRAGEVTEIVARAPRFTPGRIRGRVVRQGLATWMPATELILEGHFTGEAAPPIPGIVRPAHGPFRTAADGTFDIVVPPGRYRLREMQVPAGQTAAVSIEEVEVAPDRTVEQTFVLR